MIHGKADQGELHIRIKIGDTPIVWLCGGIVKESLKHTLIYLDENVKLPAFDFDLKKGFDEFASYEIPYTPSANRILWTKRKYVGNECKSILDLPKGEHVLSIATNTSHDLHSSKLSHVIMWP